MSRVNEKACEIQLGVCVWYIKKIIIFAEFFMNRKEAEKQSIVRELWCLKCLFCHNL